MKTVTIVGARPQFIKAAPVSRAIARRNQVHPDLPIHEILVHTGQHYDYQMSKIFFEQLELPEPVYHLGVGSGTHAYQTGEILKGIEAVLLKERPDVVVVYGDTNSTLAGALAAAKLHIPVAHVEAGLRSFNSKMPEEINRVLTDHVSSQLFCPTETAVQNLAREGLTKGVHCVGDVMYESVVVNLELAQRSSDVLRRLALQAGRYALATFHRAENTSSPETFAKIMRAVEALAASGERIVFPVHPRTRKILDGFGAVHGNVALIDPVAYLDMLVLEKSARVILTDSGGVQKEAYWLSVPCVTVREETEWVETVASGWNRLAGLDPDRIVSSYRDAADHPVGVRSRLRAAENRSASATIVELLSVSGSCG